MDNTDIQQGGLLLHACCGPCAEYPYFDLKERGIEALLYFANPNIHPFAEWQMRREALEKMALIHGARLLIEDIYEEEPWRKLGESPQRCEFCYRSRMELTAAKAAALGYRFFTSTLLVSPYQKREAILRNGHAAAEKYGLTFLDEDWREHFRSGQNMAREDGLYRQKYCGCIFSFKKSEFREKSAERQQKFQPAAGTPALAQTRLLTL